MKTSVLVRLERPARAGILLGSATSPVLTLDNLIHTNADTDWIKRSHQNAHCSWKQIGDDCFTLCLCTSGLTDLFLQTQSNESRIFLNNKQSNMQWEVFSSHSNSRGISTGNELWEWSSFSPLQYHCLVICQKTKSVLSKTGFWQLYCWQTNAVSAVVCLDDRWLIFLF